jgi:hypothetical protein
MYGPLLALHSIVRWLVVIAFVATLTRTYFALLRPRPYAKIDRIFSSAGSSVAHTQLLLGLGLYFSSPFVRYFWSNASASVGNLQLLFFSLIHITGMLTAVVLLTIGSAKARRAVEDRRKFRMIAIYWTVALLLILLLIPWPFSPLAQRPLLRPF